MSFYERHILPHLLACACGTKPINRQRAKVVPEADGVVLEIGAGAMTNLAFMDPARVTKLIAIEPSEGLRIKAAKAAASAPFEVTLTGDRAEALPLPDASVDTALFTFVLCTIPDWKAALAETRRVLKPGGRLLFAEHGLAPDAGVARFQSRIEPVWKAIAGGCHLTRPIPDLLREAGFHIAREETMYLPGTPRFAGFNYWGEARPA